MSTLPALDRHSLRHLDTNSLLRMYDQIKGVATTFASLQERAQAARVAGRITTELERRKVNWRGTPADGVASLPSG